MTDPEVADLDQAEEADLKAILDQEKCILRSVQNVEKPVKFHSNQQKENLFIAESVMLRENQDSS